MLKDAEATAARLARERAEEAANSAATATKALMEEKRVAAAERETALLLIEQEREQAKRLVEAARDEVDAVARAAAQERAAALESAARSKEAELEQVRQENARELEESAAEVRDESNGLLASRMHDVRRWNDAPLTIALLPRPQLLTAVGMLLERPREPLLAPPERPPSRAGSSNELSPARAAELEPTQPTRPHGRCTFG